VVLVPELVEELDEPPPPPPPQAARIRVEKIATRPKNNLFIPSPLIKYLIQKLLFIVFISINIRVIPVRIDNSIYLSIF
jgi:hypothetical protein